MSSLREGLRSLTAAGILEVRPGKGTFVTDNLSGVAAKQLELGFRLEGRVSRELLEVRQVLELDAVALAAERATEQELDEIGDLLTRMHEVVRRRDWQELERIDPLFHLAIVDASRNGILSRLVRSLYDLFQQMVMDTPFSEENFALHLDLFQALKERNPDKARAAMGGILEHTRYSLQFAADEA
jgi:GntR family transcriptional repressor for pyruvate dehydrogenase complex